MQSVLQDWVMTLGLRHQGAILGGLRGCDTAPKHDPSKLLVRCLRCEVLVPFCGDAARSASYIEQVSETTLRDRMRDVLKNCDHYPQHYLAHLLHAAEVIGYKKPSAPWLWFYQELCRGWHLHPESEAELDKRLLADEASFGAANSL